ncbi:MAG: methyltransferase [Mariprofundaceae bacterium]|nr:methyltransferase [Mariprofundaceae bacterium]
MSATQLLYQAAIETLDDRSKRIVTFNAYSDPLLKTIAGQCDNLVLLQHFKPEYNELKRMGLKCSRNIAASTDMALLIPSKNRQQTLGWMAEAMISLVDGGKLLVACANNHGARSYEKSLKELAGNIGSSSKAKCRVFSARKSETLDTKLAGQWIADTQPRQVESHGLVSQPGLFSWEKPDIGSQLLLRYLPETLHGRGMDLCCGYGFLSEQLLRTSPDIESVYLVEADRLALQCAERNTALWQEKVEAHWLDAASEPLLPSQKTRLDWVVCNPPFHKGQERDLPLGRAIIANGCKSLKRGGRLYMVANRKLPYETTLDQMLMNHRIIVQEQGFKIIEATKGGGRSVSRKPSGTEGWELFGHE